MDDYTGRRAFITGITGQDGSYLAELLLEKGYDVHGMVRRSSTINRTRLDAIEADPHAHEKRLHLHYGDLTDATSVTNLILETEPDEVYNLGAQSHVRVSFDNPSYTVNVNAMGTLHVLEAVRMLQRHKDVRMYQASTSEMFGGDPDSAPQSETTAMKPRSPYGCAKLYAHLQAINYREAYDLFACCGILFNHESPRRGESFVTRKITIGAGRIREGLQDKLHMGNLNAKRDWGYAKDYVKAMWMMLQQRQPEDYVIGTNETHSVKEFLQLTFGHLELDWREHVAIDPRFYRPTEVHLLLGDSTKAKEQLGWVPETSFEDLVKLMVDADWETAKQQRQVLAAT